MLNVPENRSSCVSVSIGWPTHARRGGERRFPFRWSGGGGAQQRKENRDGLKQAVMRTRRNEHTHM